MTTDRRPNLRVWVAIGIMALGTSLEGLWFVAAIGVGGNRNGWLDGALATWLFLALSIAIYWRWPAVAVVAALINLVVCISTFYADGQNLHNPVGLIDRHCVDLVILAAAVAGLVPRRKTIPAL